MPRCRDESQAAGGFNRCSLKQSAVELNRMSKPINTTRRTLLLSSLNLSLPALAAPPTTTPTTPPWPATLKLSAKTRFRYWGFDVYDLCLWCAQDFEFQNYLQHPFVLELRYLKSFQAEAITQQSLKEIERRQPLQPSQRQQWHDALLPCFKNVRSGDNLAGWYQPQKPAEFSFNHQPTATLNNPELMAAFFGIWLAPATSEPQLRKNLMLDFKKRKAAV
jgi:hypothetical protein